LSKQNVEVNFGHEYPEAQWRQQCLRIQQINYKMAVTTVNFRSTTPTNLSCFIRIMYVQAARALHQLCYCSRHTS